MEQYRPFMTIEAACQYTGLSQYFLRNGVRDGSVPHIKCGNRYMVNVPALLHTLGADVPNGVGALKEGNMG